MPDGYGAPLGNSSIFKRYLDNEEEKKKQETERLMSPLSDPREPRKPPSLEKQIQKIDYNINNYKDTFAPVEYLQSKKQELVKREVSQKGNLQRRFDDYMKSSERGQDTLTTGVLDLPKSLVDAGRLGVKKATTPRESKIPGLPNWASGKKYPSLEKKLDEWSKAIGKRQEELFPKDAKFTDQVTRGFGSFGSYYVTGLGFMKGLSMFSSVPPSAAAIAGNSVMSFLEAASEAGSVYDQNKADPSVDENIAQDRASKTFMSNLILLGLTNRYLDNTARSYLKRALINAPSEGLQEGFQQIIANVNTGRPWFEGVVESTAVGAIIGGAASTFTGTQPSDIRNLEQEYGGVDNIPLSAIDNIEAARVAQIQQDLPEVVIPPRFINSEETKDIVSQYFTPEEVSIEFLNTIRTIDGDNALGRFREGMISFVENPHETTPDHEAFHAYGRLLMSQENFNDVLQDIMDERGVSELQAEEIAADGFVDYVRSVSLNQQPVRGLPRRVIEFFRDMWNKLQNFFREPDKVRQMYRDIILRRRDNSIAPNTNVTQDVFDFQNEMYQTPDLLTLRILNQVGKPEVGQQEIRDLLRRNDVKKPERDIVTRVLDTNFKDQSKISMRELNEAVSNELLPLEKRIGSSSADRRSALPGITSTQYSSVTIPEEMRGEVDEYQEIVYTSPYTSDSYNHFREENYFAHVRSEDVGDTRRIIEVQSDLYQKNAVTDILLGDRLSKLERIQSEDLESLPMIREENPDSNLVSRIESEIEKRAAIIEQEKQRNERLQIPEVQSRLKELNELRGERNMIQYQNRDVGDIKMNKVASDRLLEIDRRIKVLEQEIREINERQIEQLTPTERGIYDYRQRWFERTIKEEVQRAAFDGKDVLQFPTGKTAALVEGFLGQSGSVSNANFGDTIEYHGQDMVVVNEGYDAVELVSSDDILFSGTLQEWREGWIDSEYENAIDDPDSALGIDAIIEEVGDAVSIETKEVKKKSGEYEYTSKLYTVKDSDGNIIAEDIDAGVLWDELKPFVSNYDSWIDDKAYEYSKESVERMEPSHIYSGDNVFQDGDDLIIIDEKAYTETVSTTDSTPYDDFEYESLGESERAIVDFYDKQVAPFLQKYRKGNIETVTDDNGVEWIQTRITPEDQGAIEVYQRDVFSNPDDQADAQAQEETEQIVDEQAKGKGTPTTVKGSDLLKAIGQVSKEKEREFRGRLTKAVSEAKKAKEQGLRKEFNERNAERKGIKEELIQELQRVPKAQRGRFLKAVKNVDTRNQLEKQLVRVDKLAKKASEERATKERAQGIFALIKQKQLKKTDNLRKAMDLPPISKMSNAELTQLEDALSQAQQGDTFLTQRQLETIKNTDLAGAQTEREVIQALADETGLDIGDIKVNVTWFDQFRYDTALAEQNPLYEVMVDETNKEMLKTEIEYLKAQEDVNALLRAARRSKKRSLADRLIPTDRAIFEYLESPNKEEIARQMTPQEIEAAEYIRQDYEKMRDYLIEQETLDRYIEDYVTHVRRGFLETWKDDGFVKAVREMARNAKEDKVVFNILSDTGEILPLEKFFQFSLRRTGELNPTQNVARAYLAYKQAFEKKRALDAVMPKLDTYVSVLTPKKYTPRGLEMDRSIKKFFNKWMNNKKGRRTDLGGLLPQGGGLDIGIRALRTFTSVLDLGLSIPVGIATQVGEQVTNFTMLGARNYTKGVARMRTKKGKEIANKYENFVGRSVWNELRDASAHIGDQATQVMFGLFHSSQVRANKQFLLGEMTDEEYSKGEITDERLARLRRDMGRWRVVDGAKSVVGSTSLGSAAAQYKTWAVPILRTASNNLSKIVENPSRIKDREGQELLRISLVTAAVYLIGASIDEDDSFIGKLKAKAVREGMSLLGALDPRMWTGEPRMLSLLNDLSRALVQILTLEEYKTSKKGQYTKGDLKGIKALKRTLTPAVIRQIPEIKAQVSSAL